MMNAHPSLAWRDVRDWGVEGKGWPDTERYFARLPSRAEHIVREPVWERAQHAAGLSVRFETDATVIAARWTLLYHTLAKAQMPATACSGLDLYATVESAPGTNPWRWVAIARPEAFPTNEVVLADDLAPGRRTYMLYLPLYNGVESLEIGVPVEAAFVPVPPRVERPLLFYGTSIVHGAAASRAGMGHPAILGRRLGVPIVNLGFGAQGQMDPEVAALLAELDPRIYVVDCLPNMTASMVQARAEPLVRTLRAAHPQSPIVLVEDRSYTNAAFRSRSRERNVTSRAALRRAYYRLLAEGVPNLLYVPGEHLLGDDGEASVDGSHPTDLGFTRLAGAFEPLLRALL